MRTEHGLPKVDLTTVGSYELLQRRIAVREGIASGELAIAEDKVLSHAQAKSRMARWLK